MPEQRLEGGTRPSEGILGEHDHIVDPREGQHSVLNDVPPTLVLVYKIPVVVTGHHHSVEFRRTLEYVSVIIRHKGLALDLPGRSEHDQPLPLQVAQQVGVRTLAVFTPKSWYERFH